MLVASQRLYSLDSGHYCTSDTIPGQHCHNPASVLPEHYHAKHPNSFQTHNIQELNPGYLDPDICRFHVQLKAITSSYI